MAPVGGKIGFAEGVGVLTVWPKDAYATPH